MSARKKAAKKPWPDVARETQAHMIATRQAFLAHTTIPARRAEVAVASFGSGEFEGLRATIHAERLSFCRGVNGSIWMNSACFSPGSFMTV